jgi:hypothetical protein
MIVMRSPALIRHERPGLIRSVGASRFGRVLDRPRRAKGGLALLYDAIVKAGLMTWLQICLDAADPLSYDPDQADPEKWLDRSGNGFDFYRGLDGSLAGDPVWNEEGWWDVGGVIFDYDSANEAWMNSLHLNGAQFSWFGEFYLPSGTPQFPACGTRYNDPGVEAQFANSAQKQSIDVRASGVTVLSKVADNATALGQWHQAGASIDENGGAVSFFWLNGSYDQVGGADTWDANYSSPGGTSSHFSVFCSGTNDTSGTNNTPSSGCLGSCFAFWTTPLTKADFDALRKALGGGPRFK